MTERTPDGFDADVMLCPGHEWVVEDRTPAGRWDNEEPTEQQRRWYLMVICEHCGAPRCGVGKGQLRCERERHHVLQDHRVADGTTWPIGGSPK